MHVSADFHGDQKEVLDLLKFELQEAVSHPTTTLGSPGTGLASVARAPSTLDCRDIALSHLLCSL